MRLDEVARELSVTGARTVLIDGRSGSGKTTLAKHLRRLWDGSQILRLDDVYPGWDGLAWAADHVTTELLVPRRNGLPGRWRSWRPNARHGRKATITKCCSIVRASMSASVALPLACS